MQEWESYLLEGAGKIERKNRIKQTCLVQERQGSKVCEDGESSVLSVLSLIINLQWKWVWRTLRSTHFSFSWSNYVSTTWCYSKHDPIQDKDCQYAGVFNKC